MAASKREHPANLGAEKAGGYDAFRRLIMQYQAYSPVRRPVARAAALRWHGRCCCCPASSPAAPSGSAAGWQKCLDGAGSGSTIRTSEDCEQQYNSHRLVVSPVLQ